ncbi:MAG: CapA family protein [Eubacteriales bacterium]|nr:CapA family protein [Eubacteriales bacterium]
MKKNDNIPLNYKERNNSRISLICSVVVLAIMFLIFHQMDYNMIRKPAEEAAKAAALEKQKAEEAANTPQITTADVIAVGDNLYHGSLIESGQSETGDWNYDHIYTHVLDEIQAADVAMIDQETVFTNDHSAVSSYPSFATPMEVGDAIIKAGFNVIESATNHIDDYGYDNMAQTLEFWRTKYPDIPVLGIHETQEDADTVKTMEVNGITIAFLDYTYGTNNSGAGEGREYMIDIFDQQKVAAAVEKAKAASDCVVFVAHWGSEDETMPNEYEKQWAAFLMQQGVDVVIGGHPHVLQPYGRLSDDQGNEMLIFYSLGNFVSTQQELPELLGGMASFTIEKTVLNGVTSVRIISPEVKPLVMHYNHETGDYGPYMLEDYTEELASQHSVREVIGEEFTLSNLKSKFQEIMAMNVKPSTNTNLLNVKFDYDGNMIDKTTGNYVEDTESIHSWQYYEQLNSGASGENSGGSDSTSGDNNSDGNDDSNEGGYDDSNDDSYDGYDDTDDGYDDSYDGYDDSYDGYDDSYDDYE